MTEITRVIPGSPAERKISPGEHLVAIDGHEVRDVLDYQYYGYDPRLLVTTRTAAGRYKLCLIEKEPGEDLGLEFPSYLMDKARSCANNCIFCFVDQLPKGLRDTLYFKDDDARLSFLMGNYITLTNLSERELERIIQLRVSPINISVHATDPEVRAMMLGNKNGGRCMEIMARLAEADITMNCQIVCCPGINDGAVLQRSMEDLAGLYPQAASVSVVPVGLTKHREGLYPLTPFTPEGARETIRQVEAYAETCLRERGSRIFFCSDELYLRAGLPLPPDAYYEGYPQLENGVGMLTLLETEFREAMDELDAPPAHAPFAIATGVAAAPFLQKLLATAGEKYGKIEGHVYPVVNDFFGHTIDVAGLLTGGDLKDQLRGRDLGERLLLSQTMLRHGEGICLDDVTLEELSRDLGVPVVPVPQDGRALLRAILFPDGKSASNLG